MSVPTILHADADAFFAAVAQRDDPALRGRPVAAGAGVVMAASYEARAFGVRGGMGGAQARRLCPELVFVPPDFDAYTAASRELFAVFREASPIVEGLSLEEAFLDVRGLERICGPPADIAVRVRRNARAATGLAITVGVGRTRLLAKMASRAAKPDGLMVLPDYEERSFLHPLPVAALWGVGDATAARLGHAGIDTVGDLAAAGEEALVAVVGGHAGRRLHAIAHNRDPGGVRRGRGRRSFGAQAALGRRAHSRPDLDRRLVALTDRVTARMRRKGRFGRTVALRVRFSDFAHITRSRTLPEATAASAPVIAALRTLLAGVMPEIERRGVTLVGVTVTNLDGDDAGAQLQLPVDGRDAAALDAVLDSVADRFGSAALRRGGSVR